MSDRILWVDSLAGLGVGLLVLSLSSWLAELYGFTPSLVVFLGCANLLYGTYSGSLAIRAARRRPWVLALIAANATWAALCISLAVVLAGSARPLGIAVLLLEALFVGGLASLEWRLRARLITAI